MAVIDVVIPAYNEEESIGLVLRDIPKGIVRDIVVVNNNSTDKTAENAEKGGAVVLLETDQGYGAACLKGIAYLTEREDSPDIIVFMDADHSDHGEQLSLVIKPLLDDGMDMVIGSRALGNREKGSMTTPQVFGNWLATRMLKLFYGVRYTDLGPFRALKFDKLLALEMKDRTYGWTVEMQAKAAKKKYKTCEVAVDYRRRIGVSKISGTVKGAILAGYKIIVTIFKYL
jgi:glycosyltransferase involved in cell wall biosynthesis